VARLREMESFKRVLAPFDVVVTQRNTESERSSMPGRARARRCSASPTLAPANLRVRAATVRVEHPAGMSADLVFTEHPDKHYPATVCVHRPSARPALANPQVELKVENPRRELFPGATRKCISNLAAAAPILRLPANA